jgi:hypothetical protein
VRANDTAVEKHNLTSSSLRPSGVALLVSVLDWLDTVSVLPKLSFRRLRRDRTARAQSQAQSFDAQSVSEMQTGVWERTIKNATVPQHMVAVLFRRRQFAPPAIAWFCLGGGGSAADLHILSPQSIYVATDTLITMPQWKRSGVQLLAASPMLG